MAAATQQDTVSLDEYQRLVTKYNKLYGLYKDLSDSHAKCVPYIKKADEKYNAAKESAWEWTEWLVKKGYVSRERHEGFNQTEPKESSPKKADVNRVTSSQATEGEPEDFPVDGPENVSDDEPELVSVRTVKRNKKLSSAAMPPPVRIKVEVTSPENAIDLGSEDYSSPVLKRKRPLRTEISDLDAHVEHIDTPRRRKRSRATSEETARPRSLLPASSLSEGDTSGIHDNSSKIKAEPTDLSALVPAVTTRDFALHAGGAKNILRPRSVNLPNTPRASATPTTVQKKRRREMTPTKVATVSEDGDAQTSQVIPQQAQQPKIHIDDRLDELLGAPDHDKNVLPKRLTSESRAPRLSTTSEPPERMNVAKRRSQPHDPVVFKRPRGLEQSPPPAEPEDEPLRLRPIKRLHLEDFKINPDYLGSDFAFADTFRGREQRRCLPGCTRPECCGDAFRKAVELGGMKSTETDSQVLEDYLGPDFATLMSAYGPDKRQEVLMQARAHAFANQHGKHRKAFERRSTPPGFWRVDMPSTQEEAEDRAKALGLERKKVEERWREAMRGGRWLFRDE